MSEVQFPADSYSTAQKSQKWLYQDHVVLPTLSKLLESQLNNKKILDIGCGNGHNTSTFLKWGAAKVVGFDNSEEMITHCKSLPSLPNAEFHHMDVTSFELNEKFDVATAVFVLQYVHDKEQLMRAISLIFNHLTEGGIFIGMIPNGVPNVNAPKDAGQKLGAAIDKRGDPYVDGEIVTANFYEGNEVVCTSKMALHANEYYDKCFKKVGFKNVDWTGPEISDFGKGFLGEEFWSQFLNPPADIVFICSK